MSGPFEDISSHPIEDTDYWVQKLSGVDYDADVVAQDFFATKKENEISSALGKITTLQTQIEKVLRKKVTSNYSTFMKARNTIVHTGLEISELTKLVDTTHKLVRDVRENRLKDSKSMRKNSMIDVVRTMAHTPKMGKSGVERMQHDVRVSQKEKEKGLKSLKLHKSDSFDHDYGFETPTSSPDYSGSDSDHDSDSSYGSDVEHENDLEALMETYGSPTSPYSSGSVNEKGKERKYKEDDNGTMGTPIVGNGPIGKEAKKQGLPVWFLQAPDDLYVLMWR